MPRTALHGPDRRALPHCLPLYRLPGIQYLLPATWTALKDAGVQDLRLLADLLARNPAKLAGLAARKGILATDFDADIVVRCAPCPCPCPAPHTCHLPTWIGR